MEYNYKKIVDKNIRKWIMRENPAAHWSYNATFINWHVAMGIDKIKKKNVQTEQVMADGHLEIGGMGKIKINFSLDTPEGYMATIKLLRNLRREIEKIENILEENKKIIQCKTKIIKTEKGE